MLRLQKHIADLGIAARRKAEDLIRHGKVKVNGKIVTELGLFIDPSKDAVEVDLPSQETVLPEDRHYVLLNKPIDISLSEKSLPDIFSEKNLIGKYKAPAPDTLWPLDSLAEKTEGLVIYADAEATRNALLNTQLEEEYEIAIDSELPKPARSVLQKGLLINTVFVPGLTLLSVSNRGKRCVITAIAHEGNKHKIISMFESLGFHVLSLKRTRIGKASLGTLPPGKWKYLSKQAIV